MGRFAEDRGADGASEQAEDGWGEEGGEDNRAQEEGQEGVNHLRCRVWGLELEEQQQKGRVSHEKEEETILIEHVGEILSS